MNAGSRFPAVQDKSLVGTYPALTGSGGGYVWDAVLEYRVWCHLAKGVQGVDDGSDYFEAFATYEEALEFAGRAERAEHPLALVLQEEYIDEPEPGRYVHVRNRRLTEWQVEWLKRPRRTPQTIPDFLASDAPNRLDVLRGVG